MLYPFAVCAFAGLSTSLGGLLVIAVPSIDNKKMAFSQGFAAGVMLAVSFMDLLPETFDTYYAYMPVITAAKAVLSLLFCGWVAGTAINGLVVKDRPAGEDEILFTLRRTAVITMLVMVIHNLPEGMLTVFTSAHDARAGARIGLAVALHNLPEGMAIASPVLYITHSRAKAFFYSLAAGMAELMGGVTAYILLRDFITSAFLNGLMPVIAGIMCQAALCEMIPAGTKISDIHHTLYGIIAGIIIMSIGLFAF
ncbi:MAG: ZIP family metal transporter [Oscillospiraceae bacterium]|nr:ZIP family metal transporter [Oscillospiraceae bacterium]